MNNRNVNPNLFSWFGVDEGVVRLQKKDSKTLILADVQLFSHVLSLCPVKSETFRTEHIFFLPLTSSLMALDLYCGDSLHSTH